MEIVILLIVFGLGVMYGSQYTLSRIEKNLETIASDIEKKEQQETLELYFEYMPEQKQVFCYSTRDGSFLAQSETVEDLLARVQDRFPAKELICKKEDLDHAYKTVTSWKKQ